MTITTSFVWDMHADVNNAPMTEGMSYVGAPFDHAVAALIDDIEARGLREKILLVCCGEMGRTPVATTKVVAIIGGIWHRCCSTEAVGNRGKSLVSLRAMVVNRRPTR